MTNITIFTLNNLPIGFEFEGHAGKKSSDVNSQACAALSMLSTVCINSMEAIAQIVPISICENGYIKAMLPENISLAQRQTCEIILKVLIQGVDDIQKYYPKTINIKKV